MSKGYHDTYHEDKGIVHHTEYDEMGRRSFDYDPLTGEVIHDHSVLNENQDIKKQWPDSNLWDN